MKISSYEGDLSAPINIEEGNLEDAAAFARENRRVTEIRSTRMLLLLKEFGIRGDAGYDPWLMLAYRLAMRHVPGMQVSTSKRGQPQKWTKARLAVLWAEVEELKDAGRSEIAACRHLIKTGRYQGPEKSLQRRVEEARSSAAVRMIVAMGGLAGDPPFHMLKALATSYAEGAQFLQDVRSTAVSFLKDGRRE